MDLSIAIVNYNTKGLLEECLDYLLQYPPSCDYEILVVDNSSRDGSAEMVRDRFPSVRLLASPKNLGYAAGINKALAESTGEFILILNPDVQVTDGSLDALTDFMRTNPRAGIAGAKLLNADGTLQYSCRTFYTFKTLLYRRTFVGRIFKDSRVVREHLMADWDHESARQVDWVLGACLMVRRAAVEEVGPADERFFLYFEDVDWCYRMKTRGWAVYYCPDSLMFHHHRRDSAREFFGPGLRAHLASVFRFYEKWSMALYVLKMHGRGFNTAVTLLGDAAAVSGAFLAAYLARETLSLFLKKPLFPLSTYGSFMAFTVAVALIFMAFFGLYRKRYGSDWADEVVDVGKALSLACVVIMASTFVLYLRAYSRVVIVSFWPISIIAVTAVRLLLRRATAAAWASGFGARRVLVLGSAASTVNLDERLRPLGRTHLELVSAPAGVMAALKRNDARAAHALAGFVDEQRITDVVCALEDFSEDAVEAVLWPLSRRGVRLRLYTKAARVLTRRSAVEEVGSFGLITVEEKSTCPADSIAKRAFDLALAVPSLVLLALYVGVAWVLSRMGGKGPLLVRQVLVGRDGRQFRASFRAGVEFEDGLPARARSRLTLVFNIARGQLSFVGPRPLAPATWENANQTWKGIRSRLVPGLIGTWSLVGGRGAPADALEAMDLQYLREWSLGLDLKIVIRTLAGKLSPAFAERGL